MKTNKSNLEEASIILGALLMKIKTELSVLFFTFLSFISPIAGLFLMVGVAVFIDTLAGVYIARKNKNFNSNNLFNVVVKTFFYMSTILLAYLIDTNVLEQQLIGIPYFSSKIATVFWIYIECKSLDEKSQKLGNKPFTTIITNLIKWVKSVKTDINEITK